MKSSTFIFITWKKRGNNEIMTQFGRGNISRDIISNVVINFLSNTRVSLVNHIRGEDLIRLTRFLIMFIWDNWWGGIQDNNSNFKATIKIKRKKNGSSSFMKGWKGGCLLFYFLNFLLFIYLYLKLIVCTFENCNRLIWKNIH